MESTRQIRLRFRFEGGDADAGELNFYDASRFEYGAARFVYTLEHFRQTGIVLSKITQRINADYRVPTLQRGSWIMDVLQIAGPPLAEMVIKVPIQAMMAHVMEKLTPGKRSREMLKEATGKDRSLGRVLIAQEKERTAQERERTEQIRLMTETNSRSLNLVSQILKAPSVDSAQTQLLKEIRDELRASSEREKMLEQYQHELQDIDPVRLDRLLDRTRGQVIEMGKPLIRSADRLSITDSSSSRPHCWVTLSGSTRRMAGGNFGMRNLATRFRLSSPRYFVIN